MITEIVPGIKFVGADETGFPYGHCLFVDSEIRAVLDTGAGMNVFDSIDPTSVDLVINSHYHKDHTWGNGFFNNARVLMHRLDYPPMVSEESRDYYTGFFRWDKVMNISRGPIRAGASGTIAPFVPIPIDGFVNDGEMIDFGSSRAVVMHTPGHTPGHCSFYFEREGLVYGADIDLIPFGPMYGDYLSNLDDFENSITRIIELDPRIYCSGHRRPITSNVKEHLVSYLSKIGEREQRIVNLLTKPLTIEEMLGQRVIYPRYDHPYFKFWEHRMIELHLERMLKREQLEMVDGERYRLRRSHLHFVSIIESEEYK